VGELGVDLCHKCCPQFSVLLCSKASVLGC